MRLLLRYRSESTKSGRIKSLKVKIQTERDVAFLHFNAYWWTEDD